MTEKPESKFARLRALGAEEIHVSWETGPGYICSWGVENSAEAVGNAAADTQELKASAYMDVAGAKMLFLTMPRTDERPTHAGMCFYDRDKKPLRMSSVPCFSYRRDGDSCVDTAEIYVPSNAAYFRTTFWADEYLAARGVEEAFAAYRLGEIPDYHQPITHELPINVSMMNMVRRARQLTDIEWEPRMDIPRYSLVDGDFSGDAKIHFLNCFKAGHRYKGIPYSGSGEDDRWYGRINPDSDAGKWGYHMMYVGLEISPETFVTAARTPNSILSYRSLDHPEYYSSPYGIVCNGFAQYCLAQRPPVWLLATYMDRPEFYQIADSIATVDPDSIRLCDFIWSLGHIAIITDLRRDGYGHVIGVEISEATTAGGCNSDLNDGETNFSGICRRKFWSIEEFRPWFRRYKLYRWLPFADIPYEKSDYVDVGNEGDYEKIIDLACVPYLGNRARYKVGFIRNTKICINASGFTELVVLKDGAEFGRFNVEGLTEVETGFCEAGEYSAYLLNAAGQKTMSCHWTVIPMDYA